VGLNAVADARLEVDDHTAARAAYEESLAIVRKLAASDPSNAGWHRALAVSLVKVGDVWLAAGDRAGALSAFEESLAIMRKLADQGNPGSLTDLVVSLFKVSTVSEAPRARAALHEAITIVEALARDNRLTAAQKDWPQIFRGLLAKLPPEAGGTRRPPAKSSGGPR
jgi:tetratricopeptide (TPR) repeat protein